MNEKWAMVTIFLDSGRTFSFRDVSFSVDNEHIVRFEYGAMSDSQRKEAEFFKSRIVGISRTEQR